MNAVSKTYVSFIHNFHKFMSFWCLGYPAPGPHIRPSPPAPGPPKIFNQLNLLLLKVQSL